MKPQDQYFHIIEQTYSKSVKTTRGVMNAIVAMDKDYQKKRLHELFNYPPSDEHRAVVAATIQYYSSVEPKFEAILDSLYEVIQEITDKNPSASISIDQLVENLTGNQVRWVSLAIESLIDPDDLGSLLKANAGEVNNGVIISWWANTHLDVAIKEIMDFTENATSNQIRSLSREIKEKIEIENSLIMMADPNSDSRREQLTILREQLIERAKELGKL